MMYTWSDTGATLTSSVNTLAAQVKGQGGASDLLQAPSGFLQRFLQPLELSGRVGHVVCGFIRPVVQDGVETDHTQARMDQLGVEPACRNTTSHTMTLRSQDFPQLSCSHIYKNIHSN